jgi:hypothetical protein
MFGGFKVALVALMMPGDGGTGWLNRPQVQESETCGDGISATMCSTLPVDSLFHTR